MTRSGKREVEGWSGGRGENESRERERERGKGESEDGERRGWMERGKRGSAGMNFS